MPMFRAVSSFLGALCQEKFWGPWNRVSFLAALKKRMIWESVQTKNWKSYENKKQFAWNAENLAIFKENDKRIWRCMNEMTRKLQK